MKVLLINTPRSPHNSILKYASNEARKFIHKKLIGPPLGLLTLAGSIPEHDVVVWDTKGEYDLNPNAPALAEMVERLMAEHQPDLVGTTVITSEFYFGIEILKAAKNVNPNVTTIIGGVHATLCINDFTDKAIDVICQGHSAHLFKAVVDAMEKKLPLESVAGIYLNTENGPKKPKENQKTGNPQELILFSPTAHYSIDGKKPTMLAILRIQVPIYLVLWGVLMSVLFVPFGKNTMGNTCNAK
ncbi:MAG: cobalamin-dependent protein [Draconibacterium sp.]|nr:cobalamin-dependent protein [Draconibacterium sp.]